MAFPIVQHTAAWTASLPSKPQRAVYKDCPHLIVVPYVNWLKINNHQCNGYGSSLLHSRKRKENLKTFGQSPLCFYSQLVWPETEGNEHPPGLARDKRLLKESRRKPIPCPFVICSPCDLSTRQCRQGKRKLSWVVLWVAGSLPLNLYCLLLGAL